jgi:hypothetical protein
LPGQWGPQLAAAEKDKSALSSDLQLAGAVLLGGNQWNVSGWDGIATDIQNSMTDLHNLGAMGAWSTQPPSVMPGGLQALTGNLSPIYALLDELVAKRAQVAQLQAQLQSQAPAAPAAPVGAVLPPAAATPAAPAASGFTGGQVAGATVGGSAAGFVAGLLVGQRMR